MKPCTQCGEENPYSDTYIIEKKEIFMCFMCADDHLMEEWLVSQGEIVYDQESERWVQSDHKEREALIQKIQNEDSRQETTGSC